MFSTLQKALAALAVFCVTGNLLRYFFVSQYSPKAKQVGFGWFSPQPRAVLCVGCGAYPCHNNKEGGLAHIWRSQEIRRRTWCPNVLGKQALRLRCSILCSRKPQLPNGPSLTTKNNNNKNNDILELQKGKTKGQKVDSPLGEKLFRSPWLNPANVTTPRCSALTGKRPRAGEIRRFQ